MNEKELADRVKRCSSSCYRQFDSMIEHGLDSKGAFRLILAIIILIAIISLIVQIASGAVKTDSPRPNIIVTFDEPVAIISVSLEGSGGIVPSALSLKVNDSHYIYRPSVNLENGIYTFTVTAEDIHGNPEITAQTFEVELNPISLTLVDPPLGVSQQPVFDILFRSDRPAVCRYSLNSPLAFANMAENMVSGGTEHSIESFSVADGPKTIYMRCLDGFGYESSYREFTFSQDTTPPAIISAFPDPQKIITEPLRTTLRVTTDEASVCRYSANESEYSLMEGSFDGNDPLIAASYKTGNAAAISGLGPEKATHVYKIACANKAGLVSATAQVSFEVDLSAALALSIVSPQNGFVTNRSGIALNVSTNKAGSTICYYGPGIDDITNIFSTVTADTMHHSATLTAPEGRSRAYVRCERFAERALGQVSFAVDRTPPSSVAVNDNFDAFPDKLHAIWTASDELSGISGYEYSIGTSPGATDIRNWTKTSSGSATVYGLSLVDLQTYYWNVRAYDRLGYYAQNSSDGVTLDLRILNPTCADLVRNQDETDVDCGGSCPQCSDGRQCRADVDCVGSCADNVCRTPECRNSLLDEGESDVDCGGSCQPCGTGNLCTSDSDCASGYCSDELCSLPTCEDLVRNQDETGTDCGGSACPPCSDGSGCVFDSDCDSNLCSGGECAPAGCADERRNQDETDIDCGGSCPACPENHLCRQDSDCISVFCDYGLCAEEASDDTDGDGMPDWYEIQNGLDPEVDDSSGDIDGEGLSNIREYGLNTNPTMTDTDGDGVDDATELAKGFDPLDPQSRPKSHFWSFFLLAMAVLILVSGGAYIGYAEYRKRSMPPPMQRAPARPVQPASRQRIVQRQQDRRRELEAFEPKPVMQPVRQVPKPAPSQQKPGPGPKSIPKSAPEPAPEQAKPKAWLSLDQMKTAITRKPLDAINKFRRKDIFDELPKSEGDVFSELDKVKKEAKKRK
ncbi:MAG: hypothetical protein ABH879_04625 [archaeon]